MTDQTQLSPQAPTAVPTPTKSLVEVRDLVVEFPTPKGTVRAVDHVDLDLGYGERLGIVGESGSGKSVLGRTIMGLTRSSEARLSGEVVVDGHNILNMSERERRALWGRKIAMVFQDPLGALHPVTPVGDQIAEAVRRDKSVGRKAARTRSVELLELVGIPLAAQRARARAHELSGGMRQRVAIAMAIACRPKLLIADEPTTALDATVQARVLDLFDDLCTSFDIGLMMVSHDLGVVGSHTDRVSVMYAGRIGERGTVHDVLQSPRMRYTSALMAAIPNLRGGHRGLPHPIPGLPPDLSRPAAGCRFAPRCSFASERCHTERPPLIDTADNPSHQFACWHPGEPGTDHLAATTDTPEHIEGPT